MNTSSGIKCRNCGLRNFGNAQLCKRCHASFDLYTDANFQPPQQNFAPPPQYITTEASLKDFGIYFGVALLIFPLFFGLYYLSEKFNPTATTRQDIPTVSPKPITTESGSFGPYKFTLLRKEGEKLVALFQPVMLPRNDAIMIGATREIIKQAFGEEVGDRPIAVGKEIRYQSKSQDYMVTIIKEDTGEIHTLIIERK